MNELKMLQGESFEQFVVRVLNNLEEFGLNKQQAFKELFNKDMAVDNIRKVSYLATYISEAIDTNYYKRFSINEEKKDEVAINYKSSTEILSDGSHKSDKLLQMSSEQSKDPNFLLEAHGFNSHNWELLSVKNNIWNSYSKQDGIMTLYSSKLTAKPKINDFDIEWFKSQFENIEPINPFNINYPKDFSVSNSNKVCEIQLSDLHIGLQGIDYEKELIDMIDNIILENKGVETFILPIGQDWLNSNVKIGSSFTTVGGTSLQQSLSYKDMLQTGIRIASHIIDNILSNTSANIDCFYLPANHDAHSCFGLFCAIQQRYKDFTHNAVVSKRIEFCDSMKSRKYRKYGVNGIGFGHGDKERNKIFNLFTVEAPHIYATTTHREYHLSHLHNESVKDIGGIVYRRLPTVNSPDDWHTEQGYVGSSNRIQVFVYDLDKGLQSINYYYINKAD